MSITHFFSHAFSPNQSLSIGRNNKKEKLIDSFMALYAATHPYPCTAISMKWVSSN